MNIAGICVVGVVTLHMLFPAVLASKPERACDYCDGYIAPVSCHEIGEDQAVWLPDRGEWLTLRAADCATWTPPAEPHRKGGRVWLGDVGQGVYDALGLPYEPLDAIVCRVVPAPIPTVAPAPQPTPTPRPTDQIAPGGKLRRWVKGGG